MQLGWLAIAGACVLAMALTQVPPLLQSSPADAPLKPLRGPSPAPVEQGRRRLTEPSGSTTRQAGPAGPGDDSRLEMVVDSMLLLEPAGAVAVDAEPIAIGPVLDADDPFGTAGRTPIISPQLPPELAEPLDADDPIAPTATRWLGKPPVEHGSELDADEPSGWRQWLTDDDTVEIGESMDADQRP